MILYFPVSALVTLFGNILQNPLDARAKSDNRLMDLVVTFLSMLGQEAEQGGVHRMLGICSEFGRIAKVVIERAEKEQASRRKRKVDGKPVGSKANTKSGEGTFYDSEVPIPTTMDELSPPLKGGLSSSFGPLAATTPPPRERTSPASNPRSDWMPEQSTQGMPQNGDYDSFGNMQDFMQGNNNPSPSAMINPFQQPLLPPDLFSLPMTLDWNWAEMSGGAYPSVENGNFGNINLNQQYPPQ